MKEGNRRIERETKRKKKKEPKKELWRDERNKMKKTKSLHTIIFSPP